MTPGLTLRELAGHGVDELKAVGPKLETGLADMGITSVLDLLDHYPRRYVDRTERAEIAELSIGDEATVDAEVRSIRSRRTRDGKRTIVNAVVYDGTGLLELVFFNQAWRERQLSVGTQVSLFGKVEQYRGKRQLTNPVVDVLSAPDSERGAGDGPDATGTVVPVYPQSGKAEVHTWQLRRAVASALQRTQAKGFADPLDGASRSDLGLVDRTRAYTNIHRPETVQDAWIAAHRLKFDEFLRMQIALVARKRKLAAEAHGIQHQIDGPLVPAFHAGLPFALTGDQTAARSPRSPPTSRRRRPCTGCSRARSVRARPSSRSPRCSPPSRVATRARSWRPRKCSPNSTSSPCAPCSKGWSCRRRRRCSASGRCGWRCSRTARARRSGGASPKGSRTATSTSWWGRTR